MRVSLLEHLKNNNYILDCPYCKQDIYKFVGKLPIDGLQQIKSEDFIPCSNKIRKPKKGEKMICPLCSKVMIYMKNIHLKL